MTKKIKRFSKMDRKLNVVQVFFLIVAVSDHNTQACLLQELPKDNNLCAADILCSETTDDFEETVKNWMCIRSNNYHRNGYDYYDNYNNNYRQVRYANDYILHVNVHGVDIQNTEDPLMGIDSYYDKVRIIKMANGNIVELPSQIYSMSNIVQISIINNYLETVNLDRLSLLSSLQIIDVSQNAISVLEQEDTGVRSSSTEKIDLSHNLLKEIPNNCFVLYPSLKILDLSHNLLSAFDILSFEGITGLQILRLSNNQIVELGQNLARFIHLKEITLNSNELTSLTKLNFKSLITLELLDLSHNSLKDFDNDTFSNLVELKNIDLSYNNICNVRKVFFENNNHLNTVSLAHNVIEKIEGGTFENLNITYFSINDNSLTGSIEKDTFVGIEINDLNLSRGKIVYLGNEAFASLGLKLEHLNLSMNLINNISKSSFQGLNELLTIDISNNFVTTLDFDTVDLINVSVFDLRHNRIKTITRHIFTNMKELKQIDLSFNEIENIESGSFNNLTKLETLILNNNIFEKSLEPNIFENLNNLQYLYLVNTRLLSYENNSLSGLSGLKYLNSSNGGLISIEYESFNGSGSIEILDFSFNQIQLFSINTTHMLFLKELYLNNNKLTNITESSFINLNKLKKINLSFNNIIHIVSNTFQTLVDLTTFDIAMNSNLQIEGTVFNNLFVLSEVSLSHTSPITFSSALNTTIKTLDMSFCQITDLDSVYIFKIPSVLRLDLSFNKIFSLNKASFQVMPLLNMIDLRSNNISRIQPGTFMYTKMVNLLDLSYNNLSYLQFGSLDGLTNLHLLNLSHNAISAFDPNQLHVTPHLSNLILDNNNIKYIKIIDFAKTSITSLSIGNNPLNCEIITSIKTISVTFNVTAEVHNFDSENINGITCVTVNPDKRAINENINHNMSFNVAELLAAQQKLNNILGNFLNKTSSNTFDYTRRELYNFTNDIIRIFNNSQVATNKQLNTLSNISDNSLIYFVNVTTKINVLQKILSEAVNNQKEEYEGTSAIIKTILQNINRDKEAHLVTPQRASYNYTQDEPHDAKYIFVKDDKTLLYILSVILGTFVVVNLLNIIYKYYLRIKASNSGSHNIIMEMQ